MRPTVPPQRIDEAYHEHRSYVLAVLARRCGWLEPDEREEILQEAFLLIIEKARDGRLEVEEMAPAQLRAFLTQTAINKALDEGKRVGRSRSVPLEDAEFTVPDNARPPEEVASAGLEGARVREIVGDLSERKRAIVKLRFFFERSPEEIQSYLGISERVYRRELERAMRQIHDGYELVRDGSYCASRRSGIIALISGIAGPGRARAAREHLATCPACAAWAVQLREDARKVGALVPLPDLLLQRGPLERLADVLGSLRDNVLDAGAGAKQQGAALLTRVDQASGGMLAAARPGAATALLAGCLTVGGGATYCAVNGVPEPVRGAIEGVLGKGSKRDDEAERRKRITPVRAVAPPPLPVVPSVAETTPNQGASDGGDAKPKRKQHDEKPQQAAKKKDRSGGTPAGNAEAVEPEATAEAAEAEPVPEAEFGFEGEAAPEAPPPSPPPATGGGGAGDEFGL